MKMILSAITVFLVVNLGAAALDTDQSWNDTVRYLLEEEKLAGDLYEAFAEQWSLRIFSNISRSEDRHYDHVEALARASGLDITGLPPGEFSLSELQGLYDHLLSQGLKGPAEALEAGRAVEIMDIEDLREMLDHDIPNDAEYVVRLLLAGSESHLSAFERQLVRY